MDPLFVSLLNGSACLFLTGMGNEQWEMKNKWNENENKDDGMRMNHVYKKNFGSEIRLLRIVFCSLNFRMKITCKFFWAENKSKEK